MKTTKEHPVGVVFAGGCQFLALGIVPLAQEDGEPLDGFGWRVVHSGPKDGSRLYQAPFVVIGGAFVSGNSMGNLPDYVEYEIDEEEDDVEIDEDAEEQILLSAMYSDMQSMVQNFIHNETDEEM